VGSENHSVQLAPEAEAGMSKLKMLETVLLTVPK
jgi:hypothetical protein